MSNLDPITKQAVLNHLWEMAHDESVLEGTRGVSKARTTTKEKKECCDLICKIEGWVGTTKITAHIGDALVDKLKGFMEVSRVETSNMNGAQKRIVPITTVTDSEPVQTYE